MLKIIKILWFQNLLITLQQHFPKIFTTSHHTSLFFTQKLSIKMFVCQFRLLWNFLYLVSDLTTLKLNKYINFVSAINTALKMPVLQKYDTKTHFSLLRKILTNCGRFVLAVQHTEYAKKKNISLFHWGFFLFFFFFLFVQFLSFIVLFLPALIGVLFIMQIFASWEQHHKQQQKQTNLLRSIPQKKWNFYSRETNITAG